MQDVTDRRKAAIELEAVRQERIRPSGTVSLSRLARTPNSLDGNLFFSSRNLLEGVVGDLTSDNASTWSFSLENVKQLKDMVSDLVDVSRVESLKLAVTPQQTFVPRLIDEVLRTCRANAALKNISLLSDIAQCLPPAWADRARVPPSPHKPD